ncbi:MAG: hypothetical protein AAGC60_25520 [Acidobacteriota bacterium]
MPIDGSDVTSKPIRAAESAPSTLLASVPQMLAFMAVLSIAPALASDPPPPLFDVDILSKNGAGTMKFHPQLAQNIGTSFDGRIIAATRNFVVGATPQRYLSFRLHTPELVTSGPLSQDPNANTERWPASGTCNLTGSYSICGDAVFMTHQQLLEYQPSPLAPPVHPVPGLDDADVGGSSTAFCDPERGTGSLAAGSEQSVPDRVDHPFLCDWSSTPDSQGDFDCYDLGVLIKVVDRNNTTTTVDDTDKIFGRWFRFRVTNPKSADPSSAGMARIVAIEPLDPTSAPVLILSRPVERVTTYGPLELNRMSHLTISGDGRLLVIDTGIRDGLQYSVISPSEGDPCEFAHWSTLEPLAAAHDDPDMAPYGIARYPLRTTENGVLDDFGTGNYPVIRGAFPWLDRDGDNLTFSHAYATYRYMDPFGVVREQYPSVGGVPMGAGWTDIVAPAGSTIATSEREATTLGVVVTGLWTHGKLFMPDNRLNPALFNITRTTTGYQDLTVYDSGPAIEVGATGTYSLNSIEDQFLQLENLRHDTEREVIWWLTNASATDEVVFDPVISNDTLIYANMNPSIDTETVSFNDGFRWNHNFPAPTGEFEFTHYVEGEGFLDTPRLGNWATSVSQAVADSSASIGAGHVRWNVPTHGDVRGGARIEPLAAGGIKGRGLWLDGVDQAAGTGDGTEQYVEFTIPQQPAAWQTAFDDAPWMVTISFNPDYPEGFNFAPRSRLLTMPDGSFLEIHGRFIVTLGDAFGKTHTVDKSTSLQYLPTRWTTISVFTHPADDNRLRVYFDGMLVEELTTSEDPMHTTSYLRPSPGVLTVGAQASGSNTLEYRGWLDDLEIVSFLHLQPGQVPNPEEVCNRARGTIVRTPDLLAGGALGGPLHPLTSRSLATTKSANHPDEAHLEIAALVGDSPAHVYRCERPIANHLDHANYTCLGQTRHPPSLPTPNPCLRTPLLLGAGVSLDPAVARPSFTTNSFCLSCHDDSNLDPTMQVTTALSAGTVKSSLDARRQPLQARPRLFGVIPQDYVTVGSPPAGAPVSTYTTDVGLLVDYLLEGIETEN